MTFNFYYIVRFQIRKCFGSVWFEILNKPPRITGKARQLTKENKTVGF